MFIARARTIRATAAAAALLAAGIATSASAEQARGLTNNNIAAATSSSSASATASTAQRRAVADPVVCVRGQRVMSRITQNFCRTSSEWEQRGGLLAQDH